MTEKAKRGRGVGLVGGRDEHKGWFVRNTGQNRKTATMLITATKSKAQKGSSLIRKKNKFNKVLVGKPLETGTLKGAGKKIDCFRALV